MIIQTTDNIGLAQLSHIKETLALAGYKTNEVKTQTMHLIVCIGKNDLDIRKIGALDGVRDIHKVSDDYKLVSSKWKMAPTTIELFNQEVIGDGRVAIMAGPCSIESEEQVDSIIQHLVENNVKIMRGGVFKPRSSPYAFRGLGVDGLKMFYGKCRASGIAIVSEVMRAEQIEAMEPFIDIFQVGARNSQNFNLLDELGKTHKPVLLKRGISGTIEELLYSAEYIFSAGNERIMLCERGIRTYETASRNTLDLNAIPILKEKTHLPVIVDPSHGIGIRRLVHNMALAGVMAGADGIIFEIHPVPEKAASDGAQTLNFQESAVLIKHIKATEALRLSMEETI